MTQIISALKDKPDYVYIVDQETADNIKISLSTSSGDFNNLPIKFKSCIESFINLTNFKKSSLIKILRITPLVLIRNGGLTYLDNKTPVNVDSIIGKISFGGPAQYDKTIASSQLSSNLDNLKICTNIPKHTIAYVVSVKDIGGSIKVLISSIPLQLPSSRNPSPPPPKPIIPSSSSITLIQPPKPSSPSQKSQPQDSGIQYPPSLIIPPPQKSQPQDSRIPYTPPQKSQLQDSIILPRKITHEERLKAEQQQKLIAKQLAEEAQKKLAAKKAANGKKYFYKYLKYKQKYLEAQQLYSKEIKGGTGVVFFIFCKPEIYKLVQRLFPVDNNTFNNMNCVELLLGQTAYKTQFGMPDMINLWYPSSKPNGKELNGWNEGLGKDIKNLSYSKAYEQIKDKIKTLKNFTITVDANTGKYLIIYEKLKD